ncbi:MAG: nickel pincer cofactor biosynthesis protein LarC [Bradymonadales bacterium]|nr:nickel pincer cofactor biosynthesis protein LarC [Bradymonadales bacterium]
MPDRADHLHLDCFSGVAGDMFLGALVDLGGPLEAIQRALDGFLEGRWSVRFPRRDAGHSLTGRGVELVCTETPDQKVERPEEQLSDSSGLHGAEPRGQSDHRSYREIVSSIDRSELTPAVKVRACGIFERIALAESRVHGCALDEVHFHELAGIDSLVDIVGASVALEELGIRTISCSPLPLGRGFTDSAHGRIPIPAPATLECLIDVPCYDSGLTTELVTPTGAGLVASLVQEFISFSSMRIAKIGYGAGTRRHPDRPNLLRAILGRREGQADLQGEESWEVSANIDDQDPQELASAVDLLWEMEPLDVWLTGIVMKKGRPGQCLTVLCRRHQREAVAQALLRHTSSIGVRMSRQMRRVLAREVVMVETPYGAVPVKVAFGPEGAIWNVAPEADACLRVARNRSLPLKEVRRVVLSCAVTRLLGVEVPLP